MQREEIINQVQDIFRDVLDEEEIILADTTTADEVEGWDSLSHIQLVVGIEKRFNIKFTSKEILSWKNVGELIDCIVLKINL